MLHRALQRLHGPTRPLHVTVSHSFSRHIRVLSGRSNLIKQNLGTSSIRKRLALFILSCSSFGGGSNHQTCTRGSSLITLAGCRGTRNRTIRITNTSSATLVATLTNVRPVIIISRSRRTGSDLSLRVLHGLGPHFILRLATAPSIGSGVVSQISTRRLGTRRVIGLPIVICHESNGTRIMRSTVVLHEELRRVTRVGRRGANRCVQPVILLRTRHGSTSGTRAFHGLEAGLISTNVPRRRVTVQANGISRLKGISLVSQKYPVHCIVAIRTLSRK